MKNHELFTSMEALTAAYARREELTKGKDETHKYTPSSILEWACFWDADTALDPKLKPGSLVEITGIDFTGYPEGSFGIVVQPVVTFLSNPITDLLVRMADGKDAKIDAKYLKPSKIPEGVLQLARNQVVEEIKAECPLYRKEGELK